MMMEMLEQGKALKSSKFYIEQPLKVAQLRLTQLGTATDRWLFRGETF